MVNINNMDYFVSETLFMNGNLKKLHLTQKIKRVADIYTVLLKIQKDINERKVSIFQEINQYNLSQKNKLRIVYDTENMGYMKVDFKELISDKKMCYFKKFNITHGNLWVFLDNISAKIGIIKFFIALLEQRGSDYINVLNLEPFISKLTIKMVDIGIQEISDKNIEKFISLIRRAIFKRDNLNKIQGILRNYLTNYEKFTIEFNINNKEKVEDQKVLFKPINKLSLGQKVVAILSFILTYGEYSGDNSPLIIDQPEDNLDSLYIYKNLVEDLKSVKSKRQVIIATHNSTIVTNAKAEQVIVMDSDGSHGWIDKTGFPTEKKSLNRL